MIDQMLAKILLFFAFSYPWILPVLILFATFCFLWVSKCYQRFGGIFGPAVFLYIADLRNQKLGGENSWSKLIATLGRVLLLCAVVLIFTIQFIVKRFI